MGGRRSGVDGAATEGTLSDEAMVDALRSGDEAAFLDCVQRFSGAMLRVAALHVSSRSVAEEVVQEAWLGVITGIGRFEGRSSFKTWLFRIVTNRAKTRGTQESRSVPFSTLVSTELAVDEPAVEPDRFLASGGRWPDFWAASPPRWSDVPETRLHARETLDHVRAAVESLPPMQRTVISLRDMDGWSAAEVCEALGLSEANQRVLLHRGRSKVRRALEEYLGGRSPA